MATVVMVPGGFLGPWIWERVDAALRAAGVGTRLVALASVVARDGQTPGGLHDDVAAVRAALDEATPPVVLCGHSYGGVVITAAAAGPHPAVRRLVYLAAAAPDAGQSLEDLAPADDGAAGDAEDAAEQVRVRADGTVELVEDAAVAALFNDCSRDMAARAVRLLRPMNPVVNRQPVPRAAWRELPAVAVRCSRDALPELLSPRFREVVEEVADLPTGHCPQWSRPDLVTDLLLASVARVA